MLLNGKSRGRGKRHAAFVVMLENASEIHRFPSPSGLPVFVFVYWYSFLFVAPSRSTPVHGSRHKDGHEATCRLPSRGEGWSPPS